ncbi:Glycosyltransferase involved in cell wall bisynthesis [Allopseudospirillum japonicum]|uniref:Glycosyltransferase involved in cell wall bisynthesis n=1 Tax=Allopseudospirillum japonicum TaxID=64971 RepID=A0A1H6SH41_9GAMM|nr:glycosyltransferase [Allopseudospirillum japonicum]SEI67193.1 Glycosyltransferase involved in cell wall bisynthesis [Allopseudospirillum japonicum]
MSQLTRLKVALVHDWLVTYAGAERVLAALLEIFPQAQIFSVVDFLNEADRQALGQRKAKTSFIQKLPKARKHYRHYLPLMPLAVEQWDLRGFDLVISSSHAVAKGVITGPDQTHICYCHSPMRYAWDLQGQYLQESGLTSGLKSALVRYLLHKLRLWDYASAARVDTFIANSAYIQRRIRTCYRREADVIYPPVAVANLPVNLGVRESFYVTASRLVPYKKIDLIVRAFQSHPERTLIVIGEGPQLAQIRQLAAPYAHIQVLGYQADAQLQDYLARAQAFIFAAEEDFGILPVEAQALGTCVVAYGRGGLSESIRDGHTGYLYRQQTPEALNAALATLEAERRHWQAKDYADFARACRIQAEKFQHQHFIEAMQALIAQHCVYESPLG